MHNTQAALTEPYNPITLTIPKQLTEIKAISYQESRAISSEPPTLLPKEEYCCDRATD